MPEFLTDLALIAIGLAVAYGGLAEFFGWLRRRVRQRSTVGVVVGHMAGPGAGPAGPGAAAARIRFTVADGRDVEVVSAAWFPAAQVGRQVPVVYDPADPAGSADRAGAGRTRLLLAPLMIVAGLGLAALGLSLI